MTVPSIGDILMLSQKAWKIGSAFAACQKQALSDLSCIEVEIGGLAKALTLLAETLYAECESDLLQSADQQTRAGFAAIIGSCKRVVDDLDSLIDEYQVIKKHRTVGGFAIERAWSDLVLAEYKTIPWTTEGGDLDNLRDLLQVHKNSITVLVQALQRLSSTRLERVVKPMAERIDSMYTSNSSLDQQLDEVHRVVQDLNIMSRDSAAPPVPPKHPARTPSTGDGSYQSPMLDHSDLSRSPPRNHNLKISLPSIPYNPRLSQYSTGSLTNGPPTPLPIRESVSEASLMDSSLRHSSSSYASSEAGQSSTGWQSPQPAAKQLRLSRQQSISTRNGPASPEIRDQTQRPNNRYSTLHSSPILGPESPHERGRTLSQAEIEKLHRSATTASQRNAFEKEAFRNSAILCDVRGKVVEYSHRINRDDPRDVEMIPVCTDCRIAVVRKRITDPETRTVRVVTSIWVFSDDTQVRMELRMQDEHMYIPYASYFSPAKVSITVPCELRFYDVAHAAGPARVAQTSWVNYVFDSPQSSALFQNELMGRTLLAIFRTEKTLRTHSGLSKSFAYAEQMCGLETLRIWQDNDTGAVIALLHFSADFRTGYLAFYLNSARDPLSVKDDGMRQVKIRGLKVPVDGGPQVGHGSGSNVKGKDKVGSVNGAKKKKRQDKDDGVISGAKIEFASEVEKREFLDLCRVMQGNLIELPELQGVN
ncbi:hypothetical protein COCSADRAFT_197410 [Bipolaris sorokiniana ND90Pr]|uniref:Fungal N-terminal domain-containing protein n=1 Tax=Cochliobolus sativus (strain ND90Pr / ATCC 201652) TaxID=665912 RepID=M2RM07_COCSN|nr:uncharacterized protein COCSADRAFT_197410 [Bipolaris sorokiniana ND90Pr]EMD67649.1 hypothetical protein COCSADRAFT_197410 [Bipolaris sorokiniana ND90Pr]